MAATGAGSSQRLAVASVGVKIKSAKAAIVKDMDGKLSKECATLVEGIVVALGVKGAACKTSADKVEAIINFDKDSITNEIQAKVTKSYTAANLQPDAIKKQNANLVLLAEWLKAIIEYSKTRLANEAQLTTSPAKITASPVKDAP